MDRHQQQCEGNKKNQRRGLFVDQKGLLDYFALRLGLQRDFSKGGFILRHVLRKQVRQCLGLLRAQEHALKVDDGNAIGAALIDGAERQEKVPQTDADLNTVGVILAIVGAIG